jgi:DNA polymerase-3 subunit delta
MTAPDHLDACYLICGSDRPKVRRAVGRLRARVIAEAGSDLNIVVFDAEAQSADAVVEAASTPGFTLGTRLLLVLGADKWKVKDRKALAAYLDDPMPDTCLAVEGQKFGADDVLRKAMHKHGSVLLYDLPKKYEMAGWVRERARAHGLQLRTPVAKYLLEVCGEDPKHVERLEREIEKLALYCRGADASEEDVDAVCTPDDDARIFDLMDAVGHRDRTRSFALLEAIFADGDPRDDANGVLFSLKRHLALLEAAAQLGQTDQSSAAKTLRVHPFTARKLLEQRTHYDRRRFGKAQRALAVAETGLRGRAPATLETATGVNHSDRLVMELALARLLS